MNRATSARLSTLVLAGALLGLGSACGGGGGSPTSPAAVAPAIASQPSNLTVTAPQSASFSVTASGTAPLHYQWKKDGAIVGANTNTYALTTTSVSDSGSYTVTVSNTVGSVTSNAALLTVNGTPAAPTFTTQPGNVSVAAPTPATFIAAASGSPSPTLQWQVSTNGGGSFTDLAGATGTSYTTPATSTGDSGNQFRVIATNGSGVTTSVVATLTVSAATAAPAFTTQPASVTITEGQSALFTVAASGTPAPTLQWQLSTGSGVIWSDIAGETAATLTVPNVALSSNGWQIRAVASNSQGTAASQAAVLTVQPASPQANIVFERQYGLQSSPSDLFLIKEDGTGQVALADSPDHEFFATLAPGGRVIYYRISGGDSSFYRVDSDGTGTLLLASTPGQGVLGGITPAGWMIYRSDSAGGNRDLYAVDATSATPTPISLATGPKHEDFLGMTASGKVIYSVVNYQANDLYITNADGTNNMALATEPGYYKGFRGETPAGKLVIDTDNGYGTGGIYSLDGVGGSAIPLAVNSVAYEYAFAGITRTGQVVVSKNVAGQSDLYGNGTVPLATSLDSERYMASTATGQVIYQRLVGGSKYDLYIVDADGSHTTRLSNSAGDDYFSAFTPDGRVIYAKVTASQYDLYMVNADGTGTVPVATSTDYEEYKGMTPDGHVIYERTGGSGITSLYAYDPGTHATTPLVTSGSHAFFVGTTPSGKVLFRRQPGNADLYIINIDGTGMIPLANTGNNEFFAAVFP